MEGNMNYYENPGPDFYTQTPDPPSPKQSNGLATASLVLGICSFIFICCGGSFIFGALGIILALLSRGASDISGNAKAGLILSIVGLVLSVILYIFMFASVILSCQLGDIIESYKYYYEYGDDYDNFELDEDYLDDLMEQYQDSGDL